MLIGRVPFVIHRLAHYWLLGQKTRLLKKERIDTGHRDRFFFHCRLRENLAPRKQPTTAGGATAMWLEHFKSVI